MTRVTPDAGDRPPLTGRPTIWQQASWGVVLMTPGPGRDPTPILLSDGWDPIRRRTPGLPRALLFPTRQQAWAWCSRPEQRRMRQRFGWLVRPVRVRERVEVVR